MELFVVVLVGLLAIAASRLVADRIGVAAPLLLVVLGLAVSLLPGVPQVRVEPEVILAGVLPPLLYSSAVNLPTMSFRRNLTAISGLSVLLVVAGSFAIGGLVYAVLPDLGFATAVALGAVVSPTDAVVTSIVRRVGVTHRVVTVLEGESLLNDATALVLLRAAVAASAATVSFGGVVGQFTYGIAVAAALGLAVGRLGMAVRARLTDATVGTVLSFATPFAASLPAEALGASGLVAAVTAGLVTGARAVRVLSAQQRLSDTQNWRTVEVLAEGAVFLLMGLELTAVVADLTAEGGRDAVASGVGLAGLVLLVTLVVRTGFVASLVALLRRSARRHARLRPALTDVDAQLDGDELTFRGRTRRLDDPDRTAAFRLRIRRKVADIDYLLAAPLGPREGAVVVWAGVRGVVTLAAAQTLPEDLPGRPLLVFVAFCVAAASLLIQGGMLRWVVAWLRPAAATGASAAEVAALDADLRDAGRVALQRHADDPQVARMLELEKTMFSGEDHRPGHRAALGRELLAAQRSALLAARDEGSYSPEALAAALAELDAQQIGLDLRRRDDGD